MCAARPGATGGVQDAVALVREVLNHCAAADQETRSNEWRSGYYMIDHGRTKQVRAARSGATSGIQDVVALFLEMQDHCAVVGQEQSVVLWMLQDCSGVTKSVCATGPGAANGVPDAVALVPGGTRSLRDSRSGAANRGRMLRD